MVNKVIIKKLKPGRTGIAIFDIDDTLLKADQNHIGIIKCINGDRKNQKRISTDEYAKDKDAKVHKDWFLYGEFNDPQRVMSSIIGGDPIIKTLKLLDKIIDAGYEFCFLTARGCEDAVKYAIDNKVVIRKNDGKLYPIGDKFNRALSAAVNDTTKKYVGNNDAEKKAAIIKKISKLYNNVIFVDDDKYNIDAADALKIRNLRTIHV